MRAIDLFSGCGGLTQGLKAAGFNILAAIEIDPRAADVYSANHPEVLSLVADIRTVRTSELMHRLGLSPGDLDLLAGCPPCQGFSRIRTRNGPPVHDERNDLAAEFGRFVRAFLPKAVMLENVPQFRADHRFLQLRDELVRLGYSIADDVFDASDFGVPQRRKRLILKALRKKNAIPTPVEPCEQLTVRDAIGSLPRAGRSGDPLHDLPERRSPKVRRLISQIPRDGGSRSALSSKMRLECHKRSDGFSDVYGRMKWDAPSPTITSGCGNPSKGRFLHPSKNRTITLREAAILQSFPTDYRFSVCHGREAIARLIGNALPPAMIARHASILCHDIRGHFGNVADVAKAPRGHGRP